MTDERPPLALLLRARLRGLPARLGIGVAVGLAAGAVTAVAEAALALRDAAGWPWRGLLPIAAAHLSIGLLVGLAQGACLALAGDAAVDRAGRALAARPTDPQAAARTLAALLSSLLAGGAAAAALLLLDVRTVARIADDPGGSAPITAAAAAILLAAELFRRALRRPLAALLLPACRRRPGLAAPRTLLGLAAAATLLAAAAARRRLALLWRALHPAAAAFLAALLLLDLLLLAAVLAAPRARRAAARAGGPIPLGAALLLLAALIALSLGRTVERRGAVRLYRREAPLTARAVAWAAAELDADGDGYSTHFGDDDCAPSNPSRSPGALERPGNGIDDDCFDGDLAVTDDVMAPPPPGPRPPGLPDNLSFVVIVVDALRPDYLGAYGYARPTSPHIDRFAARAVLFERAYSTANFTIAALASLLTGLFPGMVGSAQLHFESTARIPASMPTLAKQLGAAGFQTAVVSDSEPAFVRALGEGFATSVPLHGQPTEVALTSVRLLDALGAQRFFLVVYYLGPHAPYARPPGAPDFGSEMMDLYDSKLAATDAALAPLLDRLAQPDLAERTVVLLLADHGEAFGEHGDYYHGHNLYEETIRIPLLATMPGAVARRVAAEPVSLVDLPATLLRLAGLPPTPGARGQDLTGVLLGAAQPPDRRVFVEAAYPKEGYKAAVVTRRWKLVQESAARSHLLFDLEADPGERRDLGDAEPHRMRDLRRLLDLFRAYRRK